MIGSVALALAMIAALPGCATHRTPGRGTVSGTFVAVGGPVPVNGHTVPPLPLPGRIIAIDSTGRRVQVRVGHTGTFTLLLPPGTYRLTGYNPRFSASLPGMQCGAIHPAHVRVGRGLRHIQVVCPVP